MHEASHTAASWTTDVVETLLCFDRFGGSPLPMNERSVRRALRIVAERGTRIVVIHGARDALVPLRRRYYRRRYPRSTRLVVVPDAGHMLPMTHPADIRNAIVASIQP